MIALAFNFCKGYICTIKKVGQTLYNKRLAIAFFAAILSILYADAQITSADTVFVHSNVTARIDFRVNHTDCDTTYHGNDTILNKALAAIDAVVLDPHMHVKRITVVGTASPEGPLKGNIRLASNRARTLIDILQRRYSFPDSIYAISTIPEDWEGMRMMLSDNSSIPYAEAIIEFIDNTRELAPDIRELQMKHLDGGRPYQSMHDNVLPFLRRASVVIDCRKVIPPPTELHPLVLPEYNVGTKPDIAAICLRPRNETSVARRRFFAVKSNLLGDIALCANLGFELELWPHWSLDVPVWYSPYDITERWRIRLLAIQPEVRYWPKDAGAGHYFGLHTSVAGFNISTNGDYRYQDPNHAAFGLGLGYGYAFHLDKERRWSLEAQIGAGYISYRWIKYLNTGRNGAEVSHGRGTYWGVTRAGLTISYKFYKERQGRRWMKW